MSEIYPNKDISSASLSNIEGARIECVDVDSPAYDAGFEPGCIITAVDGHPLRDIIDWRWYSAEDEIELSYVDTTGDAGNVVLVREPQEDWGITFYGSIFDKVKTCKNNCSFCFMHQLPRGMRKSLYLRDDDFRLSFLSGTFVTFTNISEEDEARIVEQHISPLRFSLHASNAQTRQKLIGGHSAAHGLEVANRLLARGIEMHAQIVLVPGVNDGKELIETLNWTYERKGIVQVGIVPLGYTRHQNAFTGSFNDPAAALQVLRDIEPFQQKAMRERGNAWVFAADEFYRNAYGAQLLENLPDTNFYGDFEMFEDGVGIIRSFVDDWNECENDGTFEKFANAVRATSVEVHYIVGEAMQPFLDELIRRTHIEDCFSALTVANTYFGGNVDVTGLLTGQDIACAVKEDVSQHACTTQNSATCTRERIYVVPNVVLNDDALLLDNMTLDEVSSIAGVQVLPVACSPSGFLTEIICKLRAQ